MMFQALAHAIFAGERNWAWRRRVAITTSFTFQAGILYAIFGDHDLAHASMVMSNCVTGQAGVLAIYVGGGVADDHFKRQAENQRIEAHRPTGRVEDGGHD